MGGSGPGGPSGGGFGGASQDPGSGGCGAQCAGAGRPAGNADAGAGGSSSGSFGNVGVGGGQDFALFRKALNEGRIPLLASLDATGFFGEHYTSLPPPTCGRTFCLHGMLSVSKDLARGGELTLLQMAMNSPVDPAKIKKPPLNLAVVLDHSGSMAGAGKMDYAKQGVALLVDALSPDDTFTLIMFDSKVDQLFGPAHVTDKAALKGQVAEISPAGGTNIYGGLEAGYRAAMGNGDDSQQHRVIFLTDGVATAGNTNSDAISAMSAEYNKKYIGLTTIGLGSDVNVGLLRGLAESGAGNFYFIEKPEAVKEVFTEELAFFAAPIAYDLELTFSELPAYKVSNVWGTSLWKPAAGGGKLHIPSVFLVSRTSTAPGPNGGRRGGGSAIIAEMAPSMTRPAARPYQVGKLTLKYREPGSSDIQTQETEVVYPAAGAGAPGDGGDYYSMPAVEKNTLIMDFFFAFRAATLKAPASPSAARDILTAFRTSMTARLMGWTDEDLQDDLKILDQYVEVLAKVSGSP